MWMSKINNKKVIPGNCFLLGRSIRHLYCPSGYITIYTRATALKLGKLIRDVYLIYFQGIQKRYYMSYGPCSLLNMHMVRAQCLTNTISGKKKSMFKVHEHTFEISPNLSVLFVQFKARLRVTGCLK